MNDMRFHEMTYGEIDRLYRQMEADRDRWVQLVKDLYIAVREDPRLGNEPSVALTEIMGKVHSAVRETMPRKTAVESMRESIEFVVDMMNNGVGIDPKKVYPKGHYHGD